ncbi:MAG: cupin domain-containing protein [bacterium]
MTANYIYRRIEEVTGTPCPCGEAFRIIGSQDEVPVSFHVVKIKQDSQRHYHKRMTEIYYCLEGSGWIELDSERLPFDPGVLVVINPGTHHRAVGDLTIINIVVPPFDPSDEYSVNCG